MLGLNEPEYATGLYAAFLKLRPSLTGVRLEKRIVGYHADL
jgi:hypothetical protein